MWTRCTRYGIGPPLQDRHDLLDEHRNLLRQRRSQARELVGRACVLPRENMIGERPAPAWFRREPIGCGKLQRDQRRGA